MLKPNGTAQPAKSPQTPAPTVRSDGQCTSCRSKKLAPTVSPTTATSPAPGPTVATNQPTGTVPPAAGTAVPTNNSSGPGVPQAGTRGVNTQTTSPKPIFGQPLGRPTVVTPAPPAMVPGALPMVPGGGQRPAARPQGITTPTPTAPSKPTAEVPATAPASSKPVAEVPAPAPATRQGPRITINPLGGLSAAAPGPNRPHPVPRQVSMRKGTQVVHVRLGNH